jgi:hypothetical protein
MQSEDVLHQLSLELLYVCSIAFAAQKLLPRQKKIRNRNDIVIGVREHDPTKVSHKELLPLLQRIKAAYLLWYGFYQTLPKTHRHTLGARIDALWVEVIEVTAMAAFLTRQEKLPYVRLAIRKFDALKILMMVLWETKSLDDKKYIALSVHIEEIGKMFGGWSGQLQKQNSPGSLGEK